MKIEDFLVESDWDAAVRVDVYDSTQTMTGRFQFKDINQQTVDYFDTMRDMHSKLPKEQWDAYRDAWHEYSETVVKTHKQELLIIAEMFYALMRGKLAEFANEKQKFIQGWVDGVKSS